MILIVLSLSFCIFTDASRRDRTSEIAEVHKKYASDLNEYYANQNHPENNMFGIPKPVPGLPPFVPVR